ncbi:P-loop containing nucleoside triphosphate hydrolase protein [Suillus clintonianus]|uniref:P-loop containing nucleoside triphosphate hydrolase protein n=1 Tax=Suillus clintonianus TaxID=1904413 RepID=UPI001B87F4EA|nr:P-loop containing nucleoside triphosphate hydrolase protein [Suillus clintonianus]KAG2125764.1 P-loop containing nucleoside triphosphate hydrolase protein [Suillus clintonianus]
MPRRARVHFVSLKSSLVNLPISIYGPLLERQIRPQTLAVHLKSTNGEGREAYVGWTGMASASSLASFNSTAGERGIETLEIDPQYASGLGFKEGDVVELGLLYDLPYAKTVSTEPLSADDWDVVELHAAHVEGTLLSQVRVANVGQEINVWVLGRTRVRLRIVSLDTSATAALLTTDTEVSIAPKSHRKPKAETKTSSSTSLLEHGTVPLTQDKPSYPSEILRALPARLVNFPEFIIPRDGKTRAYIHPYTLSLLTGTPYIPFDPNPNPPRSGWWCARARRLEPPKDPTDIIKSGTGDNATMKSSAETEQENGNAKILHPGSKKEVGAKDDEGNGKDVWEVWLGISDRVLETHVMFVGEVKCGVGDWDLVRISLMGAHEEGSAINGTLDDLTSTPSSSPAIPSESSIPLSGVSDILEATTKTCVANYAVHARKDVVRGVPGILITGRQGMGKTSVAKEIARRLEADERVYASVHYIDFSQLASKPAQTLGALFRHFFVLARWHSPSVLVFDNLDKVCAAEVEHADSFRQRHITELFLMHFSSNERLAPSNFRGIVLLATAESQTSVHSLLHTLHVFKDVASIPPPGREARKEILASLVSRRLSMAKKPLSFVVDESDPPEYTRLAVGTEGYSPVDLRDLVKRTIQVAVGRAVSEVGVNVEKVTLSAKDFVEAHEGFVPLSLRDVPLQKSDVEWADIGGLKDTKLVLRETLEWPTKYAQLFKQSPLRLRSGLLLYGYPGCGKTLLASAVAKECGLNFISIKGPELLNKYIGQSEKSVRDIFDRASAAKPCVLFFDEFDSIAPKRGHDSTGVTDRVVNQMLTQMDGAEGLEGVYVLAATSRPDLIDSALLRPGRLDKSLLCDLPGIEGRKDILVAVSRKLTLASSVDFDELAHITEGFSGADLQALVYNAHLEVVHAAIDAEKLDGDGGGDVEVGRRRVGVGLSDEVPVKYVVLGAGKDAAKTTSKADETKMQQRLQHIRASKSGGMLADSSAVVTPKQHEITQENLLKVLKTTRPSVSREEQVRLGRIYREFVSDRGGGEKTFPAPGGDSGVGSRASLG